MYQGGEIIYKELSYKVQGILIEARKIYGPGHKEKVYCNIIEELLQKYGIKYKREVSINIYSPLTGRIIGAYKPDFIIENKIILEVKAVDIIPRNFVDQIYSYLKVSDFELGIFVNFRSPKLYIKRVVLTNDHKHIGITGKRREDE
ncbi:MAG: GxxExxY protein [Patescibacteria group bacterium]|nr:GxxExxY protein [Patescibacteria group bacterium]